MNTPLKALRVLTLDCQTTGATPKNGSLLEIGWVKTRAVANSQWDDIQPTAYPFTLPIEVKLSSAIRRITGITPKELKNGHTREAIRCRLRRDAIAVAAANQFDTCPLVIHFARFEVPFLNVLFNTSSASEKISWQVICTHEIARRLLPDLPRKSLRAIAGYLGYSLPELKRSGNHAVATALIWKKLVSHLEQEHSIVTMEQLRRWLRRKVPKPGRARAYPMAPEKRNDLPDRPGIYRMLRSNNDILYIGKATSLKQRVNSYYRPSGASSEHILEMLSQAVRLKVTPTGSALEAALLEVDEIKRLSPPYNVALRRRERQLCFGSRDLMEFVERPDQTHPLGPLPFDRLIEAMTAFATLLKNGVNRWQKTPEKLTNNLLAIPKAYAPEIDCLRAGIELFWRQYQNVMTPADPLRIVTGLGARFWWEHLQRLESTEDEALTDDTDEALKEKNQRDWDPQQVVRVIEQVLRRTAHFIRRSRWFALLSESSLAWQSPFLDDGQKVVLLINEGAVTKRRIIPFDAIPSAPAGFTTSFSDRKRHIDLETYDRLRVLTTELRRLVSKGRNIELRLAPKTVLKRKQIGQALRWV